MSEMKIIAIPEDESHDTDNTLKMFAAGVVATVIAKVVYDKFMENRRLKKQVARIDEMSNELL